MSKFQNDVAAWAVETFGETTAADVTERNHRFLEEALELVQSLNCTREEAHDLVDYVFDRPLGDPPQEVGGAQITLAALCAANDMDMAECGDVELDRIKQPYIMKKIRAKQAAKPQFSPLPQ